MLNDEDQGALEAAIAQLRSHNRDQDAEILRQHRRIEQLEKRLTSLQERLDAQADAVGKVPEPPPPHY